MKISFVIRVYIGKRSTSIASLGCVYNIESKEATLTDLHVHRAYQGRGIATWLMMEMRRFLYDKGITLVEWSDCSDRYRNTHNLYTNLGACYVYDDADPAMTWDISKKMDDEYVDNELTKKFRLQYTHY